MVDKGQKYHFDEPQVCPIGVRGISGRQPADIAIAVAAEILRVRDAVEAESDRWRQPGKRS